MKNSLLHIARTGLLALTATVMAALSACSDSDSDLMRTIPDNSTMVCLFHPQDIVEKIDMDEYLSQMPANAEMEDFIDAVKKGKSGIDLQAMVFFAYDIDKPVMTFRLTDEKDFEKTLDADSEKVGGMTVYAEEGTVIVVNDGQAWFFMSGEDSDEAVRKVKKFIGLDKDESVLAVKGFKDNIIKGDASTYINIKQLLKSEGNVSSRMLRDEMEKAGISYSEDEIKDLMQAHIFASLSIEQESMTLEARTLNDEGKSIASRYAEKSVNTDILSNFDKSATLVMASVLPEQTKKIFQSAIANYGGNMQIFSDILNRTKDNVAAAVSLSGDIITNQEYNSYNWDTGEYEVQTHKGFNAKCVGFTIAIEGNGDMQPVISQLAQMGLPQQGSQVLVPDTQIGDVALRTTGNYLIASNRQEPNNKLSDPGVFKGKSFAAVLNLSKSSTASKAVKDAFGIELDIKCEAYCDSEKAVITIKTPSSKEKNAKSALDYIIKLCFEVAKL